MLVHDKYSIMSCAPIEDTDQPMYEGWIKSNATKDVKLQLKVGLHFYLFHPFEVLSFQSYTKFQSFYPILEGFLIVFSGTSLKRSNVAAPSFWREVYFLPT